MNCGIKYKEVPKLSCSTCRTRTSGLHNFIYAPTSRLGTCVLLRCTDSLPTSRFRLIEVTLQDLGCVFDPVRRAYGAFRQLGMMCNGQEAGALGMCLCLGQAALASEADYTFLTLFFFSASAKTCPVHCYCAWGNFLAHFSADQPVRLGLDAYVAVVSNVEAFAQHLFVTACICH